VAGCSKEKIGEISQENPRLGKVLTKLRNMPPEIQSVPFSPAKLGSTTDELALLETNGVVVSDEEEYYMPEIFSAGT
jgi:hypothetical protein